MDQSLWNGIFWHHLVYPELTTGEIEDPALTVTWTHQKQLRGWIPDFVVCLSVDDYHELSTDERSSTLASVRQCIKNTLPSSQRRLIGFAHGNSIYFCGTLHSEKPTSRQELIKRLGTLQAQITGTLSHTVTIGLAFLRDLTVQGWQWAAQQAIVAQRRKVRSGGNCVYVVEDEIRHGVFDLSIYWNLAHQLHSLVRNGDINQVDPVIGSVYRQVFTENYLPLSHLRPILQCQIILMAQAAIEVGVNSETIARENERFLEALGSTFDYARMKELIRASAAFFTQAVHERYHCQSNKLISQADSLILANLDDPDLSLQMLATELSTNPSYLSRCYKKLRGQGIVESINKQRIEKARRLLLDRKLSITDIAFQLGFGSVQHFGRVFNQLEGCSPSIYRQSKNTP